MLDTIIPVTDREEQFRQFIESHKCPFKPLTKVYGHETQTDFMPCDFYCMALINESDFSSFSCLRLLNATFTTPKITTMAAIPKEEED